MKFGNWRWFDRRSFQSFFVWAFVNDELIKLHINNSVHLPLTLAPKSVQQFYVRRAMTWFSRLVFFNRKRKIFDSPNERANYAFVAAGLGVLLVVFVTFCCCCCEGSNFFTDKPRSESLEVRKMREMRNRIEKDNESGMLLTNRKFEKLII